ncbi:MAG: sulfate-transporting ATPase, partial [Myxococcota bacterium]
MADIIMNMMQLRKVLPNGKELLSGITLSFYAGAKIGVMGLNGAGKSTLLKMIAGVDTDFAGELLIKDGATVGYLPQEPTLDETLDVRSNVELGMAELTGLMKRYDELNMQMCEPLDDDAMQKVMDAAAA